MRAPPHPLRPFRPAVFLLVGLAALGLSAAPTATRGDDKDAADPLAKLAKTYKLEVVATDPTFPVKTTHGKIEGKAADKKAVAAYTSLLVTEFGLYPTDLVKRTQLKRIVLCDELAFAGQRRTAIPDYEHDTLYFDVVRGDHDKTYQRKVIHHEFFHVVDWKDDGLVYEDDRWAALNPKDFKYGTGGKNAQDKPDTSVLTDKYPGFLNHYSTTGVEEDKAEVFANMIMEVEYLAKRMKTDKVLVAKVERMKELLAKFCPDVDEKWWAKVEKVKRDDGKKK
ncbi:MAG: hypothetical protein K2V38_05295 [Gemmataceae bacterium]|nr:hypothetical protein [Gemmataceae bacterium]